MIIRGQEAAREAADYDRFYVLDDDLHRALCDLSGHEIAWSLSQRAKGHLNRVRRLSLPEPGYLMEMISEHRAVVAAVAEHDPDAAEQPSATTCGWCSRRCPRSGPSTPTTSSETEEESA